MEPKLLRETRIKRMIASIILFFFSTLALYAQPAYVFSDRAQEKIDKKDIAGAIIDLNEAIKKDKTHALSYARRGYCHAINGRKDLAESDWKQAETLDAKLPDVYKYRAQLLVSEKKYSDALPDLNKGLTLMPGDLGLLSLRADVLMRNNEAEKALPDLNAAIKGGKADAQLYFLRAKALENKDHVQALKDAEEALRKDPQHAGALLVKASLKCKAKKFDEALQCCNQIMVLSGKTEAIARMRQTIFREKNDPVQELSELNELLDKMKVKDQTLLLRRVELLTTKKDFVNAAKDLNKLIISDKENPLWYKERAKVFLAQGKSKEPAALADLKKVQQLDSKDTEALGMLALLHFKSSRWDDVVETTSAGLKVKEDANLYYLRSKAWYRKDNKKACCTDLEKAAGLGNTEAKKDLSVVCR